MFGFISCVRKTPKKWINLLTQDLKGMVNLCEVIRRQEIRQMR